MYQLFVVIGPIVQCGDIHGSDIGEKDSIRCQPLFARVEHRVEHGLVEQEVPHPLGYYDIHFVYRQDDLLHQTIEDGNFILQVILLYDVAAVDVDVGFLDAIDVFSPGLG